jgi:hypothetical protein
MGALLAPLPPLGSLVPSLPSEVLAIIDRAVAVEPDQRPSADFFADALAGAASIAMPARPVSAVTPAVTAARPVRWQPWLLGGAIVAGLVLAAVKLSGGSAAAVPTPPAPADDHTASPPLHGKQAKDLNKVRDDLAKGHTEPARHHLDEYEDHYGASDETRALRAQLGALDAQDPGPGHDDPDHDDDDRPDPPPDPRGPAGDPPHPPGPPPHHGHHHR